ncbi:helix-turn-helix domain-containing protein [Rhizobium phaseoli]|uniref:helix-turn-helix domain-containing protein n=1 Tax=Rhizobium phaseoli TaxID=396 RepID=UPI002552832D|nr:helix-turn-helix transcriptional regulator [Rhizobium phaseoli]MDK4730512.1 helix-turn-helix transcriptional regulator [Rhizobium phaseoli]
MTNRVRTHISGDTPTETRLAPKHLTKQQFGKRLYNLMLAKGWTQSELARQSDLPRDSISVYVRGKSLPTPGSLSALAKALGVASTELLPNHVESAIDEDTPALELRVSTNAADVAWLRVNRLVSTKTALKIMEMLETDNAVDGTRSSGAPAV